MRAVFLAVMFTSPLIAAPAFAQGSGFYVGGELGAVISTETDQRWVPATTAGTTGSISTDHDLGFSGSVFAGYDFGMFRIEAEAGHTSADIDELTNSFPLPGGVGAGSQSASGEATAQSLMANAIVEVGGFQDFGFFVGGGAGVAKVEISGMQLSNGSVVLDDKEDEYRTAWQLFAGVSKPLTSNIDMHLRYRYFSVDEIELVGFGGRAVTAEMTTHSVTAGITYRF